MKLVSLVATCMFISFSAAAQTSSKAANKSSVAHVQKKAKVAKSKSSTTKVAGAKNVDVTTLTDEKSYKAKWTFEQMLQRRLEVDAEDAEKAKQGVRD